MPKFLFLNALSIGKNETSDSFRTALKNLVTTYPESDVSAMAKDILALMKQGQEVRTGTSSGSLIARRDEKADVDMNEISTQQFSSDKLSKHRILFISSANKEEMNKLLYNIASFNFSRFMIKDFDLVISKMDSLQTALSVTNFESYDEAVWYENTIATDSVLNKLMNTFHVEKVIISEENYALIKTSFNLNDYLAFQLHPPVVKKQIVQIAENKISKKTEVLTGDRSNDTKINPDISTKVNPLNQIEKNQVANNKTDKDKSLTVNDKIPEKTIDNTIDKPVKNPLQAVKPTSQESEKADGVALKTKKDEKVIPRPAIQPKQDDVPLFKGLFGYRANEPHFIAIYILSGKVDFEKTKAAFDVYNSKNYGLMNLKVSLETMDKRQVIIIGSLTDAFVAKSYLLRMVKEKSLFEGLKGANYRNLLGSQKNLNVLMQQNALNQYFEFMQLHYLK